MLILNVNSVAVITACVVSCLCSPVEAKDNIQVTTAYVPNIPYTKRNQSTTPRHSSAGIENANESSSMKLPTVAIIGGGIAGLSCASHLSRSGRCVPTVFDTGRLRPGGRCSSRFPNDTPKEANRESERSEGTSQDRILRTQVIDHAAQMIRVTDPGSEFAKQMRRWEEEGIVSRFPSGSVCELLTPKTPTNQPFSLRPLNGDRRSAMKASAQGTAIEKRAEKEQDAPTFYYGVQGMGRIPLAIARDGNIGIEQDVWVSPINGVKYVGTNTNGKSNNVPNTPRWRIKAKGQTLGEFDRLVVAHNGKCADRLMSTAPAKELHSLLRVNFAPTVPSYGGNRMTLNSIYSLVFAVKKDSCPLSSTLPPDVISLFVKNEPNLRFLSCNTRKHQQSRLEEPYEIWTVLSSPKFAKQYKAPQENLPEEIEDEVTSILLEAVERALGLEDSILKSTVVESKLQLWGAAVPLNTWAESPGFVYDATYGVGACGDWLLEPSIEGAWESGRRLANWICKELDEGSKTGPSVFSVGLPPNGGKFKASQSASQNGIASFNSGRASTVVAK